MTGHPPFLIAGPANVSFSGGRTSGRMLHEIVQAHGGMLPADVHVSFANTGKEREETLEFVRDCGEQWGVDIAWLEYDYVDGRHTFRRVDFGSASRNGEPFEKLIQVRSMLPNPVMRFCTQELKIRIMKKFMLSLGYDRWLNVVGLRADEPGRVRKLLAPQKKERWTSVAPLFDAGITERDVLSWWAKRNFNLRLESWEGNCDGCFLKAAAKLARIERDHPGTMSWWANQEAGRGASFRNDRPDYAAMQLAVQHQKELPFFSAFDDTLECSGCTDQEPEADLCGLRRRKAVAA